MPETITCEIVKRKRGEYQISTYKWELKNIGSTAGNESILSHWGGAICTTKATAIKKLEEMRAEYGNRGIQFILV